MDIHTRFIYVTDPMCSWCWGFAPEISRVAAHLEDQPGVSFEVVVGGLRPGPDAQPLDARLANFLRPEWTKIHEVTGQPFSFGVLDWEGWSYDTEVPAAAVALARSLGVPDLLAFMGRIQRAFYAESVDITRPESYAFLWTSESDTQVSAEAFVEQLRRPASRAIAYADFTKAREMGVRGFPALVFERDRPTPLRVMVSYGYQPYDQLEPVIDRLLEGSVG